jgi:16S rRNA (adenine1518-N6/adenine1519-N6)-dimethyltransferase
VPAGSFSPRPKVDSAIISLEKISKKVFVDAGVNEKNFFEVVRAGFAHKRKILSSNLKNIVAPEKFADCNIDQKSRAENLTIGNWVCLARD